MTRTRFETWISTPAPLDPFARWVSVPTAQKMAFLSYGAAGAETRRAKWRHRVSAGVLASLALVLLEGCGEGGGLQPTDGRAQKLPTATIRVGDVSLVVEVADEEAERATGMMFRDRLGPDEAMLFVFPRPDNLAFYAKNCAVNLDLAFLRADGTIAQTERLKAYNEEAVFSREPVQFALETPAGWLKAHGAATDTQVEIPADVAASGRD